MAHEDQVRKQIATIVRSIRALARALDHVAPSVRDKPVRGTSTRRLKLSPQRRAALKLHGSYLGHVRQLTPTQRTKVKAMKAKQGYHAAIKLAKQLAGR